MIPLLSSRFTACAMDRRGHGESGDSADYSLAKEAEDVAAVVDSRRGRVFVLGHSYGGVAALEATFLTEHVSKLVLYEPPLQDPIDFAVIERVEKLIDQGEREQAAVTFWREVAMLSPDEIEAMRSRPVWPSLVDGMVSHPRQMRALAGYRFDPERMRGVTMPTLLLLGSDTASPHIRKAIASLESALPDPTLVVLEGQEHNAMDGDREQLARVVTVFLSKRKRPAPSQPHQRNRS
jgi:pimeloyl-ACP methyl ester carboxylesterase